MIMPNGYDLRPGDFAPGRGSGKGRATVTITMAHEVYDAVKSYCDEWGMNVATFARQAIKEKIFREGGR